MSKNTYIIAIVLGIVLSLFLLLKMKRTQRLEKGIFRISSLEEKKYTLLDSITVGNNLFLIESNGENGLLTIFHSEREKVVDEIILEGNYKGVDTTDYNNDGYSDICIRLLGDNGKGWGAVNQNKFFIYWSTLNNYSEVKNTWEAFGSRGKEYRLAPEYFASPPYYEGSDIESDKPLWASYLWKMSGLDIIILGKIEQHHNKIYYSPFGVDLPTNISKRKLDLNSKELKNIETLDSIFRAYWESNIDRLIANDFE